jgi:hypothetical protein
MQKKRKSPWPFQEVLGFLRHFILLFGAYDSFRQNNVMPWATGDSQLSNSCLFSFYHCLLARGITHETFRFRRTTFFRFRNFSIGSIYHIFYCSNGSL